MAVAKRFMIGGAFYKGYKLTVLAVAGDYVLDMILADKSCATSGIMIVPDKYGAGDHFMLEHINADGLVLARLAETIYNVGAHVSRTFDFPAMELLDAGDKFRLTYTSIAGIALTVYTDLERLTTKSGGA